MKKFNPDYKHRDGRNAFVIEPSDYICNLVLSTDVRQELTIPDGAAYAVFSCIDADGDPASFWARINGFAVEPAANVIDGSGSEPNPTVRYVKDDSFISVVSPEDAKLTIMFYEE